MAGYISLLQVVGAGPTPHIPPDAPLPDGWRLFIELLSGFEDAGVDLTPVSPVARSGHEIPDGSRTATVLAPLREGEIVPADGSDPRRPDGMVPFPRYPYGSQ